MIDSLGELGLDEAYCEDGAEFFIENVRYIGLIKLLSGAECIVPIDQLIEESVGKEIHCEKNENKAEEENVQINGTSEWDKICFYISPIGSENSDERKYLVLFLESIVSPAIEGFGFKVVRLM